MNNRKLFTLAMVSVFPSFFLFFNLWRGEPPDNLHNKYTIIMICVRANPLAGFLENLQEIPVNFHGICWANPLAGFLENLQEIPVNFHGTYLLIQSSRWFPWKPPRNTSQLSWYVFAQPIHLLASLKTSQIYQSTRLLI